jgi:hypothetical protein
MSIEYDKNKLLKDKKKKGDLLKNEQKGEMLKNKKKIGNPLWKNDRLNEKKDKVLIKE